MWRQRRRILNRKTEWAIKMADNKTVIFHNKITEVLMSLLFVQVGVELVTGDDGDGHGQPE